MRVELVTQDDEVGLGIRRNQSCYVLSKVRFGSGGRNRWGNEFAGGQVDVPRQDLCPMPDVVELSAFHPVFPGWQGCPVPLQSLYAWFFVNTDAMNPFGFILLHRSGVQFADFLDLLTKLVPVLNVGVLPVPTSVWL